MFEARLAEMDLGVDHAGQDGEAAGVETVRGRGRAQGAEGRDSPVLDPDVAGFEAVRRRHLAARQNKVEIVWHSRPPMILSGRGNGRKMKGNCPCLEGPAPRCKVARSPPQSRDARSPFALKWVPLKE
jgi:hypothetical protein